MKHSAIVASRVALAASVLLVISGCVTEPAPPLQAPVLSPPAQAPPPTNVPAAVAAAAAAHEQCASNMHELSGLLLQYYVLHQELPETLEGLLPMLGFGQQLPTRCPASGREYLYFPEGLRARDDARWLVLADADAAHGGNRSGIVISEPQGNRPLGMWVVVLTDEQVRRYTGR